MRATSSGVAARRGVGGLVTHEHAHALEQLVRGAVVVEREYQALPLDVASARRLQERVLLVVERVVLQEAHRDLDRVERIAVQREPVPGGRKGFVRGEREGVRERVLE